MMGWIKAKISASDTGLYRDIELNFKCRQRTVFHSFNWLRAFHPTVDLWYYEDTQGNVQSIFLFIETIKNYTKGLHIPPFTQYFTPLMDDDLSEKNKQEIMTLLLKELNNEKRLQVLDLKFFRGHHNILSFHWQGFQSALTITYVVSGDYQKYFSKLNKNKVREIKALYNQIKEGNLEIVSSVADEEVMKLYKMTSERADFAYKENVLKNLLDNKNHFNHVLIGIRSKEKGLISYGLFPYDNHSVYNIINASMRIQDDPVLKTANLLMLNEAIKFSLDSGRVFDFEGSMLPGVSDFYRLMGGTQMPVYRLTKSKSIKYSIMRALAQIKNDKK
jgi:hypothetical protein